MIGQGTEGDMKTGERRDFDTEAAQWDEKPQRLKLAQDVAAAIVKTVDLSKKMDVLDFGCGTGLVTLLLQPHVGNIVGADSSIGMINILEDKIKHQGLHNVRTQLVDFEKGECLAGMYDLIVSNMTVHHVPDTAALFRLWHDLLKTQGRVYFADLDSEDGSFHSDNTGVHHMGFDRVSLKRLLADAGFSDVCDTTASVIIKDVEGGGKKEFPVFLISGRK